MSMILRSFISRDIFSDAIKNLWIFQPMLIAETPLCHLINYHVDLCYHVVPSPSSCSLFSLRIGWVEPQNFHNVVISLYWMHTVLSYFCQVPSIENAKSYTSKLAIREQNIKMTQKINEESIDADTLYSDIRTM